MSHIQSPKLWRKFCWYMVTRESLTGYGRFTEIPPHHLNLLIDSRGSLHSKYSPFIQSPMEQDCLLFSNLVQVALNKSTCNTKNGP